MEKLISNNFKRRLCMVLVFILGIIIILIALISFLIISSNLTIEISKLNIGNIGKEKTTLNDNFKIIFSLKFLKHFCYLNYSEQLAFF